MGGFTAGSGEIGDGKERTGSLFGCLKELLGDTGPGKKASNLVGSVHREALAYIGESGRLEDGKAEVVGIEAVGVEGIAAELHGSEQAAVGGENGRGSAGHGLNCGHPEWFVAAGEAEDIEGAIKIGHLIIEK